MNKEDLYPQEFLDVYKVIDFGAKKYGENNWVTNPNIDSIKNFYSMSHHLLEATAGKEKDEESGLDPLLHLACRALMMYTVRKRKTHGKNSHTQNSESI